MPSFTHNRIDIAYLDEGGGEPVILVHGFACNNEVNWVQPGWVSALTAAGRRVIALDNRGHGASTKLYDTADYSVEKMGGDVVALMDHLTIERAESVPLLHLSDNCGARSRAGGGISRGGQPAASGFSELHDRTLAAIGALPE